MKIEQTYTTSDRHHNQMEPHATTAVWEADGTLTLYDATQHIFGTKELVAIVLGIPPERINVVSRVPRRRVRRESLCRGHTP